VNPCGRAALAWAMWTSALLLVAAAAPNEPQDARVPVEIGVQRAGLPPWTESRFLVRFEQDERGWLRVLAEIPPSAGRVRLEWRYARDPEDPERIRSTSSSIEVQGTPTALVPFGENGLLVACMADDGHTVIERIELGPETMGPETNRLEPGAVKARGVVYRSHEPHHPVIAHFCGLHGRSGKEVTALTWDTSEVLAFDPEAGSFRVLASPRSRPEPGALFAPDLARTYHSISSRDHREQGYMLWLGTAQYDFVGEQDRTLVLIDGDRDGRFDRSMLLDSEGWAREDLSNSENYVN
jgi:hypothetical protein